MIYVEQWRGKEALPFGKYALDLEDKLHHGMIGTHFERDTPDCPAFMRDVLTHAIIDFHALRKEDELRPAYAEYDDLISDPNVRLTKADVRDICAGYDADRKKQLKENADSKGFSMIDKLMEISSKPSRDFIRLTAIYMEKHFGEVKSRWIWEIQEALGRNTHGYDRYTGGEYKNSIDKRIINLVIADLREKGFLKK